MSDRQSRAVPGPRPRYAVAWPPRVRRRTDAPGRGRPGSATGGDSGRLSWGDHIRRRRSPAAPPECGCPGRTPDGPPAALSRPRRPLTVPAVHVQGARHASEAGSSGGGVGCGLRGGGRGRRRRRGRRPRPGRPAGGGRGGVPAGRPGGDAAADGPLGQAAVGPVAGVRPRRRRRDRVQRRRPALSLRRPRPPGRPRRGERLRLPAQLRPGLVAGVLLRPARLLRVQAVRPGRDDRPGRPLRPGRHRTAGDALVGHVRRRRDDHQVGQGVRRRAGHLRRPRPGVPPPGVRRTAAVLPAAGGPVGGHAVGPGAGPDAGAGGGAARAAVQGPRRRSPCWGRRRSCPGSRRPT